MQVLYRPTLRAQCHMQRRCDISRLKLTGLPASMRVMQSQSRSQQRRRRRQHAVRIAAMASPFAAFQPASGPSFAPQVLAIVYFGVVISDIVTFYVGTALRQGFFAPLKQRLFKDPVVVDRAEQAVQRWSKLIGLVQRFSLGFRGPLCLVAGFLGVKPAVFASRVAAGAFGTMALQLTAGYFLRHSPNAYLAALALVAAPNLVGHLAGPLLTALGLWQAGKAPGGSSRGGLSGSSGSNGSGGAGAALPAS